jgi:hypothetical protein
MGKPMAETKRTANTFLAKWKHNGEVAECWKSGKQIFYKRVNDPNARQYGPLPEAMFWASHELIDAPAESNLGEQAVQGGLF